MNPWRVDEALALYRDDPRFPAVMAATHPCRNLTCVSISHNADDELIALVTLAAMRADMEIAVVGIDHSVLRPICRIKAVADACGRDCLVVPGSSMTTVRFTAERANA